MTLLTKLFSLYPYWLPLLQSRSLYEQVTTCQSLSGEHLSLLPPVRYLHKCIQLYLRNPQFVCLFNFDCGTHNVGPKCFKLFPLPFDLVYDNMAIPRDCVQQYAQIMADEEDELEEIRDRIRLIKVEKEPAI